MQRLALKETLLQFCETFVSDRITRVQDSIRDVQDSLFSETKSSAGDKHETGRAMLQLEREKLGVQLAKAERMQGVLAKVNIKSPSSKVALGSLVHTAKSTYFMAVSAGEFKEKDQSVYCISMATPVGQLLMGKSVGDSVVFNGETITVLKID